MSRKKEFAKYVGLAVFEMTCVSIYVIADTFLIAQALGPYGLTALNISISAFTVIHGVGLMVGIGGATLFSIVKSSDGDASDVFTLSLMVGAVASAVFFVAGAIFTVPISAALGANHYTLDMVTSYIRTILYFSPVLILRNILLAFIRNDGNPKLSMAGSFVGAFANIILDYIFLFPLAMGMFGAALATGVSLVLSVAVLGMHFFTQKNNLFLRKCRVSFCRIRELFALGASSFISEMSVSVSLIAFNLVILGVVGNIGVAAFGVVINLAVVSICVFSGVAFGMQPLISRGHGSSDNAAVRLTMKYALVTVSIFGMVIYVGIFIFTPWLVYMFNSEANEILRSLAESGLRIYFVGLIFAGINVITSAFFSACDKPKIALTIGILRSSVVLVPMLLALSRFGMYGVWWSYVATEVAVFILAVFLLKFKMYPVSSSQAPHIQ
ncbi:MAG: MATE family efflux transporter [Defluviitaleaceae bacterium]|nr:MATE family efflux transporter [Defluviitaleaceae bacterium]